MDNLMKKLNEIYKEEKEQEELKKEKNKKELEEAYKKQLKNIDTLNDK